MNGACHLPVTVNDFHSTPTKTPSSSATFTGTVRLHNRTSSVAGLSSRMATLSDILASQDSLVQEAAEALPFSFSQCTYSQGHIRQALYYCLTCAEPRGICSACSVACHTDHEQVELFPKRNFRCDCPTTSLPHPCTLHSNREEPNTGNSYNHNFHGKFCRCGREYDAHNEVETMIQCLACEVRFFRGGYSRV